MKAFVIDFLFHRIDIKVLETESYGTPESVLKEINQNNGK